MLVRSIRAPRARRSVITAGFAATAALVAAPLASAIPVSSVPLSDGNVLNVQAIVGTGSNSAYEVVDFNDGAQEAWQLNYNGSLNGYQMLQDIEAATTLTDDETYFSSFQEHEIFYLYDGSHSTDEYPDLYYSPPGASDTPIAGSQGINYAYADVGIDDLNITNGEIIGWDTYNSGTPVLPETAVPEPATMAVISAAIGMLGLRRRQRSVVR